MDEDRRHDHRRRQIAARADRERESSGKRPYTNAERDAYIDRQMWRDQAEADRRDARRVQCQTVYSAAATGIIVGVVCGPAVAAIIGATKWIFARYVHL